MLPSVLLTAFSFLAGLVIGVLATLATFRADIAVLKSSEVVQDARLAKTEATLEKGLEQMRKDINNLANAIRAAGVTTHRE